jgi:hypothetical protein
MLRLLLYIFCGLLMIPACSDAPTKIERDNPDDPEAPTFSLESSDNISTEILDNKVIRISWEDSVKFADYYILSKSLNNSGNYTILDTIDIQTKEYEDASGEINLRTRYLVYNERVQENGAIISSDSIYTGINFGNISYPDTSSYSSLNSDTTAINFTWGFETNWPFISLVYYSDSINNEPIIIDTLYNGTTSYLTPLFEKDFNDRNYFIRTYVSENDISNGIFIDEMAAGYFPSQLYNISVEPIETINENKTIISWNDNIDIETGFEIYRSYNSANNMTLIATLDSNSKNYTDTNTPYQPESNSYTASNVNYESYYLVKAIKRETSLSSEYKKSQVTISAPTLNYSSSNETEIQLSWEHPKPYTVSSFILQRSINNDESFEDYKTFPNTIFEFTDDSLNVNENYYYKLRTLVKKPVQSPLFFSYGFDSNVIDSFSYQNATSLAVSKNDKYLVAASGKNSPLSSNRNEVVIYDLDSRTELYRKNIFNTPIDGIDINEDNNLLAVASASSKSIRIIDFLSDTLVFEMNNLEVHDIKMSPDLSFLYSVDEKSNLSKFDINSNEILFSKESTGAFTNFTAPRRISISPSGDSVAINYNNTIRLFDSSGNVIPFDYKTVGGNTSEWVKISNNGKYISSTIDYANITRTYVQSLSDGDVKFYVQGNESSVDFDSRNQYAIIISRDSYYLIDIENSITRTSGLISEASDMDKWLLSAASSNIGQTFFVSNSEFIKMIEFLDNKKWVKSPRQFTLNPRF